MSGDRTMAIINGNAGNNTLNGKDEADTINGFAGNDTITGGLGNDLARLGAGNDTFIWRFGDGSDTLRGQDGFDTLVIEDPSLTTITRDASHAIVFDLFGNVLDLDDIERIFVRALAGADGIFIDNLANTDIKQVVVDLAGTVGGIVGDGEVDGVVRNGGAGNDVINVALASGIVSITGPSAAVTIRNADKDDILEINGLGGNDAINASKLPGGVMQLSVNGDAGNDIITGSRGNDELDGGDGNDTVAGGRGDDTVDLGTGNDLYAYSIRQGNDTVHGGDGIDTLRVTCTNTDDLFTIEGDKTVVMAEPFQPGFLTVDNTERIRIQALGGADFIGITDLRGSGVREVAIDLAASAGGTVADTSADTIQVQETFSDDGTMTIEWSGSNVVVRGFTEDIRIAHAGKNDTLFIGGSLGNDVIDASDLAAGKVLLKLDGGAGDDALFGSSGNDTAIGGIGNDVVSLGTGNDLFLGGSGNDVASLGAGNDRASGDGGNDRVYLGAGNDVFVWRLGGGDTVAGGAGIDTFEIRGEAEFFLSAQAGRVVFSHSGSPPSFLDDVERIRVLANDGPDIVHVGTLAGTDLKRLDILDFDGSPLGGGTDVLDLDPLFDALGVAAANRAGRVSIVDKGTTVDVFVNADGNAANGFELAVATLHTPNTITVGEDVTVGT
jgi:Ca2+-binding RTX toxin-like protein